MAFELGLHCLHVSLKLVSSLKRGNLKKLKAQTAKIKTKFLFRIIGSDSQRMSILSSKKSFSKGFLNGRVGPIQRWSLLIRITVGHGPAVLSVGANGSCWGYFSSRLS